MSDAFRITCAISATLFGIMFLSCVMNYGGHEARVAACICAFFAVISQFTGQYVSARRPHLIASYLGFAAALLALILFAIGR